MAEQIKLAIPGVTGRMGRSLVRCALADDAFAIGAVCEATGHPQLGQTLTSLEPQAPDLPITNDVAAACRMADVWIDFTVPGATLAALPTLREQGTKAVIIGTTGFAADDEETIRAFGDDLVVVKAGNFSLGVNLLTALTKQAAARLGPDWDIEILETHHRHKFDAPSGTALMLGDAAAEGRGVSLEGVRSPPYDGITGAREPGAIGFSVRRSGGVIGEHEASFASEEEILSLSHTALNRDIFAKGALHAAKFAAAQSPGFYTMADVLDL